MENSAIIIQVLLVAAVVAYSVWSAVKKASEKKEAGGKGLPGQQQHRMGENFPFPKPKEASVAPASVSSTTVELPAEAVEKKVATMTDGLAVASVQAAVDVAEDEERDLAAGRMAESKFNIDLRTMVISSELLKPKYEEY